MLSVREEGWQGGSRYWGNQEGCSQRDFLEEVALELGPGGWIGLQKMDMEGTGAIGETKGTVWIKAKAVPFNMPVRGTTL